MFDEKITSYPGVNALQNYYPLVYYYHYWFDDKISGVDMYAKA